MSMGYKDDVAPGACWATLCGDPDAFLIDVRTVPEWTYVGVPKAAPGGRSPLFFEWQSYPSMAVDPEFATKVAARIVSEGGSSSSSLYFICRSGVRSMASAAALTAEGFSNCFNVIDGFEGPVDGEGHRGRTAGWKAEGLPWSQR